MCLRADHPNMRKVLTQLTEIVGRYQKVVKEL